MRKWIDGARAISPTSILSWCCLVAVCSGGGCAKPHPQAILLPQILTATWTWVPVEYYVTQIDSNPPVRFRASAWCDTSGAIGCRYPFSVTDDREHLFRVWAASASAEGPKTEVRFSRTGSADAGPSNPAGLRVVVP